MTEKSLCTSFIGNMAVVTNFVQEIPTAQREHQKEKPISESQESSLKRDFARENSAFQLIIDNDEDRIKKLKSMKRIRGTILILAIFCTLGILCTMTALYISERQRRINLASEITKDGHFKQVN